jgi:hypothetical protein
MLSNIFHIKLKNNPKEKYYYTKFIFYTKQGIVSNQREQFQKFPGAVYSIIFLF